MQFAANLDANSPPPELTMMFQGLFLHFLIQYLWSESYTTCFQLRTSSEILTRTCVFAPNGSEDDQSEVVAGDFYRRPAEPPESPNAATPAGSDAEQLSGKAITACVGRCESRLMSGSFFMCCFRTSSSAVHRVRCSDPTLLLLHWDLTVCSCCHSVSAL